MNLRRQLDPYLPWYKVWGVEGGKAEYNEVVWSPGGREGDNK